MPAVSIVTISYNQQPFIGRCIESVLAQTSWDWEQVIVDDGSTDTTAETAKRYCLSDHRIRFIKHEHIGFYRLSELYNAALAASKGELVAILEADDYWPAWKLERQIPAFADHNVVLAWGKVIEVNQEGLQLAVNPPDPKHYLEISKGEALRELLLGCYIPAVSVMCRKSALEQVDGFKQPHRLHCTDYPTWLALARLGDFKFVDSVLGYWVRRKGSLSSRFSRSTAWCKCSMDAFKTMPEDLKQQTYLTQFELKCRLTSFIWRSRLGQLKDRVLPKR